MIVDSVDKAESRWESFFFPLVKIRISPCFQTVTITICSQLSVGLPVEIEENKDEAEEGWDDRGRS